MILCNAIFWKRKSFCAHRINILKCKFNFKTCTSFLQLNFLSLNMESWKNREKKNVIEGFHQSKSTRFMHKTKECFIKNTFTKSVCIAFITLYHIIAYHTIAYHTKLHHTIPHNTTEHHTISTIPYNVVYPVDCFYVAVQRTWRNH